MGRAFSFAEVIKGRDAVVPVTDDELLHVIPFVMVVTGKDRNNAGRDLRDLKDEFFHSTKIVERRLSTHGGPKTKLISFQDAIELVMVLPGKIARKTRKQFVEIIVRYLDGDETMCQEIQKNNVIGKVESYLSFCEKLIEDVQNYDKEPPKAGYIYATKSPAFPGLIKIGRTSCVHDRLLRLNTSCAPAPHVIVAMAPTLDMKRDEKTVHAFFSEARREGEFFQIQDDDVISYFATHIITQYNLELSKKV